MSKTWEISSLSTVVWLAKVLCYTFGHGTLSLLVSIVLSNAYNAMQKTKWFQLFSNSDAFASADERNLCFHVFVFVLTVKPLLIEPHIIINGHTIFRFGVPTMHYTVSHLLWITFFIYIISKAPLSLAFQLPDD